MLIVDLEERETRLFPRIELFDGQGQSKIFQSTRDLAVVELRDVSEGVELRARGLIGVLPLTPAITLNIRPKFPLMNLWMLLSVADENYERYLPIIRSYENASGVTPHQLLARVFCHYLGQVLQHSVAKGYYEFEYRGHYRPKINIGKTLAVYASRGNVVQTVSEAVAFSARLRVNGFLKSACVAFVKLLPHTRQWKRERSLLGDALNALHHVPMLTMTPADIFSVDQVPSWLRAAYRGVLSAYGLLLGFSKIGFGFASEGTGLPSFLFSLDTIFEAFIRNTFRKPMEAIGVAVLDGNNPNHQRPLFADSKKFPVKPDLLFKQRGGVLALGEVKYKPKIEEADRYQLISHVLAHNSPCGIWFSPSAGHEKGLQYVGSIAGAKFYHYRFDLAADVSTEQKLMIEAMSQLFLPRLAALGNG